MILLKHQQQPDDITCMSTCLAIILDLPAAQVIEEFHESYRNGTLTAAAYLRSKGLKVSQQYPGESLSSRHGFIYLVSTPSLNQEGGMHSIVIDRRAEAPDSFRVYDPNDGREGKKFYWSGYKTIPFTQPLARPYRSGVQLLKVTKAEHLGIDGHSGIEE